MIKYLDIPKNSRLFFVSDIHGCFETLNKALESAAFVEGIDFLISAGDLIDRGPNSFDVALKFSYDNTGSFFTVIGNHDEFAIKNDVANWLYNGGSWALEFDSKDIEFMVSGLKNMPYAIETSYNGLTFGVVHAGMPKGVDSWYEFKNSIDKRFVESIWTRDAFSASTDYPELVTGIDYVIHGHTPVNDYQTKGNSIYIDTGCAYNGSLTLLEVTESGFVAHKTDNCEKQK